MCLVLVICVGLIMETLTTLGQTGNELKGTDRTGRDQTVTSTNSELKTMVSFMQVGLR